MSNIVRPAFVKSIQRMQCVKCGAEANASCNCGEDYKPAADRVREYDEANPGTSTRKAATDLGVSQSAVQKARQSGEHQYSPEVTGRDGKQYPATNSKEPREPTDEEFAVKQFNFAADSVIETAGDALKYVKRMKLSGESAAKIKHTIDLIISRWELVKSSI